MRRAASVSTSEALGRERLSEHFFMRDKRGIHLWAAPKSLVRPADFNSGILADLSSYNRWMMKPEVTPACSEIGLRARPCRDACLVSIARDPRSGGNAKY